VDERLPDRSQQQTLRLLGGDALGELVERYVEAWERNDVDAMVTMLAEDARMAMPPIPSWYAGREQVAAFLRGFVMAHALRWRLVPTSANGQPAVAAYVWSDEASAFVPHCLNVLTLRGSEIVEVDAFLTPDVFAAFGMPEVVGTSSERPGVSARPS
jgi:RNA polymerase sigma-70 factor (ECF subfamily)